MEEDLPEIGDIFDCRHYDPIGHFIVIVGVDKTNNNILYYYLNSRLYKVIPTIIEFFNWCIRDNYARFKQTFTKERAVHEIHSYGNLKDVVFLDQKNDYPTTLTCDSIIVINREPNIFQYENYQQLRKERLALIKTKLTKHDKDKVVSTIKNSSNVGDKNTEIVSKSYYHSNKESRERKNATK